MSKVWQKAGVQAENQKKCWSDGVQPHRSHYFHNSMIDYKYQQQSTESCSTSQWYHFILVSLKELPIKIQQVASLGHLQSYLLNFRVSYVTSGDKRPCHTWRELIVSYVVVRLSSWFNPGSQKLNHRKEIIKILHLNKFLVRYQL